MGQLTGGVAHDSNNLLMPIIGSLDMLVPEADGLARDLAGLTKPFSNSELAAKLVTLRALAGG